MSDFYCKRCGLIKDDFESNEKRREFKKLHRLQRCGLKVRVYQNKKGKMCEVLVRPDLYDILEAQS